MLCSCRRVEAAGTGWEESNLCAIYGREKTRIVSRGIPSTIPVRSEMLLFSRSSVTAYVAFFGIATLRNIVLLLLHSAAAADDDDDDDDDDFIVVVGDDSIMSATKIMAPKRRH